MNEIDMDFLEDLTIRIMLYTRVEISKQILENTRAGLDQAIRSKEGRAITNGRTSLVMSVDRYLDSLHDYNNYLSGRLPKDAAKRHFLNEIDATSKLIQTLKESM